MELPDSFRPEMDAALDDLEAALRECPDDRWEASVWPVLKTDPWIWPAPGVEPLPERTEASIQRFSAFWAVATHCLWFLDQYVSCDMSGVARYEPAQGGPEELPFPAADGAVSIPGEPLSREALLGYLDFGRTQLHAALESSDLDLAARCPGGHPHAGKTLGELMLVNLAHVQEHGAQLLTFARSS